MDSFVSVGFWSWYIFAVMALIMTCKAKFTFATPAVRRAFNPDFMRARWFSAIAIDMFLIHGVALVQLDVFHQGYPTGRPADIGFVALICAVVILFRMVEPGRPLLRYGLGAKSLWLTTFVMIVSYWFFRYIQQ